MHNIWLVHMEPFLEPLLYKIHNSQILYYFPNNQFLISNKSLFSISIWSQTFLYEINFIRFSRVLIILMQPTNIRIVFKYFLKYKSTIEVIFISLLYGRKKILKISYNMQIDSLSAQKYWFNLTKTIYNGSFPYLAPC